MRNVPPNPPGRADRLTGCRLARGGRFPEASILLLAAWLLLLVACQQQTSRIASPTPGPQSTNIAAQSPTAEDVSSTPETSASTAPENVATRARVEVSGGEDSAANAIDDDDETIWSANGEPPQSLTLSLDQPYLVSRIELVVAQMPAGQTTHEIWLGRDSENLTLYEKLTNYYTSDGDTVVVDLDPPTVIGSVMIRTQVSPSWTAWREVRVYGQMPSTTAASPEGATQSISATEIVWPEVRLRGAFELPVHIAHAGDGSNRLFVVEQTGQIRVLQDGTVLPEPLLAISERVSCCGEQGLLGLVFPPGEGKKQHFYVSYTDVNGDLVIARYYLTEDDNLADPDSEEVVLTVPQPAAVHNGGSMVFGPDGYLYIGVGDGGLPMDPDAHAQSLETLLGKILRIDVESGEGPYRIPDDNPFVDVPNARGEIWALGLRNPWRMTFDSLTGDLYIADVGEANQEEVNVQPSASTGGENYGWPIVEGLRCTGTVPCDTENLTPPVTQYSHAEGCSVTGGVVYREIPDPSAAGIYLFADFCSGKIWGMQQRDGRWYTAQLAKAPFMISTFGEDEAGRVYVADYTHGAILALDTGSLKAPVELLPSP